MRAETVGPALPATYWWLFTGMLVMALATFVFPFLALFLGARGFSTTEAGLVVALFGAGSIPAGPLAGHFTDRLGRRPTLLAALVASAAFTALLPMLHAPALLALGTLALGVAVHAYFPAANALVADVVPRARYNEAFGRLYWARNIGVSVSFALGGALAQAGYERLFWADAATTLLFALVVLIKVPETRRAASQPASPDARRGGFGEALADRRFVTLLVLNVAFLVALFQFMVAVPVTMTAQGLSPAAYGRAMAVNGVLIALLQPFASRLTSRFAPARVLAVAALLVGLGYGAYVFCTTGTEYAIATGVWSLGEILCVPTVSALVAQLAPAHLQGRYQGLLGLSFGLALTLAPVIGGAALESFGATWVWAGTLGLSTVVALTHLASGRVASAR